MYLCIPGWPQNYYVADDELELLMSLPLRSLSSEIQREQQGTITSLVLNQGLMRARSTSQPMVTFKLKV